MIKTKSVTAPFSLLHIIIYRRIAAHIRVIPIPRITLPIMITVVIYLVLVVNRLR